ncbi:MotE family protein [Hansschlegelia zhihuaiae]|uniref:Flagellar protein FlbB n=1 Tax=Hansschlegelia zhihuaiae TaxID=405005 RepID=A0A4Q0MGN0_9HYPH|nr:flagellar protein FlbB [Hansschlegelia zhihuaiae]RXF72630.1 flagellar protein FlbB [Hansschlegelia zhihuaiae]
MTGVARTRLRLMPVVITAAAALLALKAIGLSSHSSYLFVPAAAAAGASAQENAAAEDQGSDEAGAKPKGRVERPPVDRKGELDAEAPAERALLDALGKRREAIEARSADLDLRENLLKAAEKRMEERLAELARLEEAVAAADRRRAEQEGSRLKEVVTLYEGMKPKEAARIFEKLDPQVLLEVASRMKPRQLSTVMGLMSADAAQKLTVSLTRREVAASPAAAMAATDLPKIEGRPAER